MYKIRKKKYSFQQVSETSIEKKIELGRGRGIRNFYFSFVYVITLPLATPPQLVSPHKNM